MRVWVWMGGCFQIIYSYIATVPAVEQWYLRLRFATLYRIPCLK